MPLITTEQAIRHLRLDFEFEGSPPTTTDPRYPDLLDKMVQAENAVLDYLKLDGWGADPVPPRVTAATLMVLGSLYDDRDEGKLLAGLASSDLTNPAVALLYRLRDPALA